MKDIIEADGSYQHYYQREFGSSYLDYLKEYRFLIGQPPKERYSR